MTEKIGKVVLDYSKYPGEDHYCDGAVEDEILELVRQYSPAEYSRLIEEKKSWPILYHLSPLRENIVDWLPMEKDSKVLEVGSGCGAITGALSRKAGSVTCVDLSKKRSMINACRHADCENITIHVGNFKDIEPELDRDYDYICLIGVFEYGQGYIGGETPYEDFLRILTPHLRENGRIVIAIENKYGLKYFAGCKEDHLGNYFSGIENYPHGGGVRTFSRRRMERIFRSCGVKEAHFYYPYPDYKLMTTLYSDEYLPGKGELSNNLRNFDRDRMLLFDEKRAFDGLVEDGLFSVFANSYLAVIGGGFDIKYVKYSNDRAEDYVIRTVISRDKNGAAVRKYPLSLKAREHVKGMEAAYGRLVERYEGGKLDINRCTLEEKEDLVCARFEFVDGIPLSELMDRCLDRDDLGGFHAYFREYVERVGYNSEFPVADFDLIFSNILVDGDHWTLIDYEWTFGKPIKVEEVAFRAIYCYLLEDEKRNKLNLDIILQELGITEADAEQYRKQEMDFQRFVTGQRCSMAQIRELIGYPVMEPQKWIHRYEDSGNVNRVQIYEDTGAGFQEESSYFVPEAYQGENLIRLELKVSQNVKTLRIDPGMDSCMVKILEMTFNGVRVPLTKRRVLTVNGRAAWDKSGDGGSPQPTIVFPTKDPNLNIGVGLLEPKAENILYALLEIVRIPMSMAQDMAGAVKKLI